MTVSVMPGCVIIVCVDGLRQIGYLLLEVAVADKPPLRRGNLYPDLAGAFRGGAFTASIPDRQLNMDGRAQFNIGSYRHMALVLFGDNVIGERQALTGIETFCSRFAGEKRLEQVHLFFSGQSKSIVLDLDP
jgi:hypothetical protein